MTLKLGGPGTLDHIYIYIYIYIYISVYFCIQFAREIGRLDLRSQNGLGAEELATSILSFLKSKSRRGLVGIVPRQSFSPAGLFDSSTPAPPSGTFSLLGCCSLRAVSL